MKKPNIILIHGHDLGRWLSCYGLPGVPSPNLQHFANESIVFNRAFATAPLCTPARSSIFTGLSPHVNGLVGLTHDGWRYRRSIETLPELLAKAGYHSVLVGLQHEHLDPTVIGFTEVQGLGFLPRSGPVADVAEAWLKARVDPAPFFMTVGMWEIHRPWRPEDYEFADPATVSVPNYLPDTPDTREDLAGMYGSIRQFDAAIGKILTAIDSSDQEGNTMVIVTTDHGAALPRAKSTLYDPGVEVAFIVRPPRSWRISPDRRNDIVSHLDLVPTLLELAGIAPNPNMEGTSLLHLLTGSDTGLDRALYLEKTYHDGYDPKRAIRTSRWKFIRNFADGPELQLPADLEQSATRRSMGDAHLHSRQPIELYDLDADPDEFVNLSNNAEFKPIVDRLSLQLEEWMRRTGDPLLRGVIPPAPRLSRLIDAAEDLPQS